MMIQLMMQMLELLLHRLPTNPLLYYKASLPLSIKCVKSSSWKKSLYEMSDPVTIAFYHLQSMQSKMADVKWKIDTYSFMTSTQSIATIAK